METAKPLSQLLAVLALLFLSACGGASRSSVASPSVSHTTTTSKAQHSIPASSPSVQLQRPPRPSIPPSANVASVYLTTDDQVNLMAPQASVNFADGAVSGEHVVIVDETQTYQQIDGFGAAFTDSSCYLLNQVATPSARADAMNHLFTRIGNGIGLSFMRTPMGASDLARTRYSYDDMPQGQTDVSLTNFSIAHDQADIIPIILQAHQLNPQMKLMATPWSPPGWMKSTDSLVGGSLKSAYYTSYANYFVKYLQAYTTAGVTVDYLSLQNEPENVPVEYPGMSMDAATQTTLLRDYVLPAFATNALSTKLLVYDHNWDDPTYSDTVLSDTTLLNSTQVAGTAWHWYAGTPGVMNTLHNKYPAKANYETEASGGTWITDEVRTDFETITQTMRNWSGSFIKWGLALDENRGPHDGGCGTCTPLVTVNSSTGAVTYPIDFYTLGHFSRFVIPGAHRIYSSNATGIVTAAFVNPDGSKVVIAFNDTPATNSFQIGWGSRSLSYSLPAFSGATFVWYGTQSGSYFITLKSKVQASSFIDASGLQTETTTDTDGGYDVGFANDGFYAHYKNLNLNSIAGHVDARVASAGNGGTIEFHLDSTTGPLLATVTVPITGGWQTWTTVTASTSLVTSGIHDLYVVFKGTTSIGNLNWFAFKT